jgi:hypothetical protein
LGNATRWIRQASQELLADLRPEEQDRAGKLPKSGSSAAVTALEVLLEAEGQEVLEVVHSDKSADEKMRAICKIDKRYVAWKSTRWAQLLGVKDAAIRKTTFWTSDRKRILSRD